MQSLFVNSIFFISSVKAYEFGSLCDHTTTRNCCAEPASMWSSESECHKSHYGCFPFLMNGKTMFCGYKKDIWALQAEAAEPKAKAGEAVQEKPASEAKASEAVQEKPASEAKASEAAIDFPAVKRQSGVDLPLAEQRSLCRDRCALKKNHKNFYDTVVSFQWVSHGLQCCCEIKNHELTFSTHGPCSCLTRCKHEADEKHIKKEGAGNFDNRHKCERCVCGLLCNDTVGPCNQWCERKFNNYDPECPTCAYKRVDCSSFCIKAEGKADPWSTNNEHDPIGIRRMRSVADNIIV